MLNIDGVGVAGAVDLLALGRVKVGKAHDLHHLDLLTSLDDQVAGLEDVLSIDVLQRLVDCGVERLERVLVHIYARHTFFQHLLLSHIREGLL